MPLTGIVDLPLELLIEITSFVSVSIQDVLQLRCVDKAFYRVATPVAFKSIIIHTTDKSTRGSLNLLNASNIVNHVRDITLVEDPSLNEQPSPPETGSSVSNRIIRVVLTSHYKLAARNDENVRYERGNNFALSRTLSLKNASQSSIVLETPSLLFIGSLH
jgi:hypothetical protein